MSEAQAGFRKGYSTTDQIFTLKCIVELFLCQGRRLFCTFVDYSKAFDSINRATLWKKTNIMWHMYKSIKSCVMANGMQSEFFESHVGLRQGENLSLAPGNQSYHALWPMACSQNSLNHM